MAKAWHQPLAAAWQLSEMWHGNNRKQIMAAANNG